MKHLLKLISSLTILSTGILSVSCTKTQTNPNKNINEQNSSSRNRRSIPDASEIKLETVVSEDIKNKGITALKKVFKDQEEAFGSFHTYQDVLDQFKVYLKDMNIYHLDYLFLTNQNEKNNLLKVDNDGVLNNIKISYFDKQLTFTPKIVLENKVKDKYNDNGNELIQVGYQLQDLINNIKLTKIRKNTIKVPIHLPLKINSLDESFKGLESPKIDNLEKWNTKNIKFLTKTFEEAKNFNQSINSWDVSNVIDMTETFAGAIKFNQNLDLWNTSKVKTMKGMFWDAENFNGNVSTWKTKSVEDMEVMFSGAKNFNQDLSRWDVSRVETMKGMFSKTDTFNSDISNWDTSNVSSMEQMFEKAKKFNQDLHNWNVKKVTHAENFNNDGVSDFSKNRLPKFNKKIFK